MGIGTYPSCTAQTRIGQGFTKQAKRHNQVGEGMQNGAAVKSRLVAAMKLEIKIKELSRRDLLPYALNRTLGFGR